MHRAALDIGSRGHMAPVRWQLTPSVYVLECWGGGGVEEALEPSHQLVVGFKARRSSCDGCVYMHVCVCVCVHNSHTQTRTQGNECVVGWLVVMLTPPSTVCPSQVEGLAQWPQGRVERDGRGARSLW